MRIAKISWVQGDYFVTDEGRIYNNSTGQELTPKIIRGYYSVQLRDLNGERKNYRISRIVFIAFYGEIPAGYQIDHINRDCLDNRLENLRAITQRENIRNSVQNGRMKVGYSFDKRKDKWRAGICINKKPYFLGLFQDEESAKYAYEKALRLWEEKGELPLDRNKLPHGYKHCSGCNQDLPYSRFYYLATYKRYTALCRECQKAEMRRRRAEKKESISNTH